MKQNDKIYVAGHRGLVGSAIFRKLKEDGYNNIITRTHKELDLCSQIDVDTFFREEQPNYVFMAAAKVGGIQANKSAPAEFLLENLMMQNNVISSSAKYDVKKLLFLGSSCIFPRESKQPIKEDYLLSGKLEPTNEGYAIAKIAGIKLCEYYNVQYGKEFISLMPCNMYGIGDNFDLENSHFLPALIRKFHDAKENNSKEVVVWGTGKPRRELLFSEDLADACVHFIENYSGSQFLNIGSGIDYTITEVAEIVKNIVGYDGSIVYDTSKPDGMPKKLMDVSRATEHGWRAKTSLEDGIKQSYDWYLEQLKSGELRGVSK